MLSMIGRRQWMSHLARAGFSERLPNWRWWRSTSAAPGNKGAGLATLCRAESHASKGVNATGDKHLITGHNVAR